MFSKGQTHSNDKASSKQRSPEPSTDNLAMIAQRLTFPTTLIQQARIDPGRLNSRQVLQLQDAVGNQAVQRLLRTSVAREMGPGHTLKLYVVDRSNHGPNSRATGYQSELSERFRVRVQRLLPLGCRLVLHWYGPNRSNDGMNYHLYSGYYRAELVQASPSTGRDPLWKRELQNDLALSIQGSTQVFSLVSGTSPIIGGYNLGASSGSGTAGGPPRFGTVIPYRLYGILDVRDLEGMGDQFAANALAHELREQRAIHEIREEAGDTIDRRERVRRAHARAVRGETVFMGGERRQNEYITRGVDFDNPPESQWQWWIPFQRSDNSVVAQILTMYSSDVSSTRSAGFSNMSAYTSYAETAARNLVRRGVLP